MLANETKSVPLLFQTKYTLVVRFVYTFPVYITCVQDLCMFGRRSWH